MGRARTEEGIVVPFGLNSALDYGFFSECYVLLQRVFVAAAHHTQQPTADYAALVLSALLLSATLNQAESFVQCLPNLEEQKTVCP